MHHFYCLVLVLFCFSNKANVRDSEQIDEILNKSFLEFSEFRFIESFKTARIALELSKNNKYSKGIAKSNIYIAKVLLEIGAYSESLTYINDAEKEPFYKTYINVQVESHRLRGRIYANLKMYDLSIKEFYKQLSLSSKIEDNKIQKISSFWAHENLAHVYSLVEKRDSVWSHLMIQQNVLKEINEKEVYYDLSTTYAKIASEYINHESYPKAKIYLDKSMRLLIKYNSPYRYYVLEKYGDLEKLNRNHIKAIKYYEEALENAKTLGDKDATVHGYKILANYYTETYSDNEKASKYFYLYNKLNDSLDMVNKNTVEKVLDQIINSRDMKKNRGHFYFYILGSAGIGFIIIFFLFKNKYQKLNRLKKETVVFETLNSKREEELYDNLIASAKANSPEFIVLFEKKNPDLFEELRKINPNIRSSELAFCAMAFLNFSTKDISEFTFVTIRAVQIRKNRIRKKYNIPSDQDFNSWMRDLVRNKSK